MSVEIFNTRWNYNSKKKRFELRRYSHSKDVMMAILIQEGSVINADYWCTFTDPLIGEDDDYWHLQAKNVTDAEEEIEYLIISLTKANNLLLTCKQPYRPLCCLVRTLDEAWDTTRRKKMMFSQRYREMLSDMEDLFEKATPTPPTTQTPWSGVGVESVCPNCHYRDIFNGPRSDAVLYNYCPRCGQRLLDPRYDEVE